VITVIQGNVTLNTDGKDQAYTTGQSFTEIPGQTLRAFNRGSTDVIVVATYLVPGLLHHPRQLLSRQNTGPRHPESG